MTDKTVTGTTTLEQGSDSRRQSIVDQYGRRSSRYGSVAAAYGSRRSSVQQQVDAPTNGTLTQSQRKWSEMTARNDDFNEMTIESENQAKKQAELGFWQALRTYHTAATWSVLLASTIIVSGS